nr:unnamed protein product [Callosobruchus analis]
MEIDVTPGAGEADSSITTPQCDYSGCDPTTYQVRDASLNAKKNIKHALRQQAKRRRKNTILATNTQSVPRIIVKPLPPQNEDPTPVSSGRTPTMREVLASIPGFAMQPRRRTGKKLSTAAQLEQTKEGRIDLETPDSILVNTNLRHLLNKATFAALPLLYQNKLIQLLPSVDRYNISSDNASLEINNSGLNNEFFARACLEWQDRLAEGEFTPENQQKLKLEADKERNKVDPWKLKHFEPIWGDRSCSWTTTVTDTLQDASGNNSRPPIKTTIKLRPSTLTKQQGKPPVKRLRTVGAMTRSCTSLKSEMSSSTDTGAQPLDSKPPPIPDLLPIKQMRQRDLITTEVPSSGEKTSSASAACIVNISDTILENNEETIIICAKSNRRRSEEHLEEVYRSPKRKTPSPEHVEVIAKEEVDVPTGKQIGSSNEYKISETAREENLLEEEDKVSASMFDENSSSSSSGEVGSTAMAVLQNHRSHQHHMDTSRNDDTMETVDSLQLHVDYKDEQTDETSSTATTATDKLSEQEEEEEEEEQEETLAATPDISNMAEMDSDPLKLNDNDREEGVDEGSDEEEEEEGERVRENEFEEVAAYESVREDEGRCRGEVDRIAEEEGEYSVEDTEEIEEGEDEEIAGEEETELQGVETHVERGSKAICDSRQLEDTIKEEKTLQSDISISSDATTTIDEPDEHNEGQHNRNDTAGDQPLESDEPVRSDQPTTTLQMLPDDPSTLMLQQGTLTRLLNEHDRVSGSGSNGDPGDGIVTAADFVETLEASVEECDLVIARLTTCAEFARDPSIPNEDVPAVDEDDRFLDAETYVLEESGQISTVEAKEDDDTITAGSDIRAAIFSEAVGDGPISDECCWGMVDSTTEKLLETVATAAVAVNREHLQSEEQCEQQQQAQVEKEKLASVIAEEEQVRVIPMREELEVRLEEATFPVVLSDWSSYASAVTSGTMHLNSNMVAAALATTNEGDCGEAESEPHSLSGDSFLVEDKQREQRNEGEFPAIDHQQQVKLELEVTLTPEIVTSDSMITSTVGSGAGRNGSEPTVTSAGPKTLTTVIPPTTIVCLPSAVTTAPLLHNNNVAMAALINETQVARLGGTSHLQSSSAVPYLALTPGQAIRRYFSRGGTAGAVKARPKSTGGTGNSSGSGSNRSGRGSASNKPPPGAVNLERSYQICQAVIQNSPNRDQLRCQLKPPPSLLAAAQRLPYGPTRQMGASGGSGGSSQPVVVRHVFTAAGGQGIPVTMAVLPPPQSSVPSHHHQGHSGGANHGGLQHSEILEDPGIPPNGGPHHVPMGVGGQYILVQRGTEGGQQLRHQPRSNSAPPNGQQQHSVAAIKGVRPASAETGAEQQYGMALQAATPVYRQLPTPESALNHPPNDFIIQCPNPGTQAVTRRQRLPTDVVYDDVSIEGPMPNYTVIGGENVMSDHHPAAAMQPGVMQQALQKAVAAAAAVVQQHAKSSSDGVSCACSLKAMVVCKKCGVFCHDDCIGPNELCRTCFIR